MKVLVIGGSRNIGYYAAQRLLAAGETVTFLLRNKSSFDNDESIKPYIASGKARIVVGDALKEDDVRRSWEAANEGEGGSVDMCLFTVGGTPKFNMTKGFVIDPPDLCTRAMLNVLATMPRTGPQPKLILISSTGLSKASHAQLPLPLKLMYGYLLRVPHADKLGMERAVAHVAGWTWEDEEPKPEIMPEGWSARLPEVGFATEVLVVRPALLTDGKCKADEGGKYRAEEREVPSGYSVSRRDVAHFIVESGLKDWAKWKGKCVRMAY